MPSYGKRVGPGSVVWGYAVSAGAVNVQAGRQDFDILGGIWPARGFFPALSVGCWAQLFFGTAASLLADLLAGTLHTLQPPEAGTCCTVACYTILLAYHVQPSIVMCCDIYAPG